MKDFKSFLIGFLMCACMFLFMGQTIYKDKSQGLSVSKGNPNADGYQLVNIGRYQITQGGQGLWLVDTINGELFYRTYKMFDDVKEGNWNKDIYWEKEIEPLDFRNIEIRQYDKETRELLEYQWETEKKRKRKRGY
jgi:hypothetical protein